MFSMRDFGTGLPDDPVFEYRTRYTHLQLNYVQKATKSFKVERVEKVAYSDHGVTCFVLLANSKTNEIRKVEHFDLWYFENGPEAFMDYVKPGEPGANLATNWKLRPFLGSLQRYFDEELRVVPSQEKFETFVTEE